MRPSRQPNRAWELLRPVLLTLIPLHVAASAGALELIFDPVDYNFQPIDQSYGDRVTMTPQGGLEYGTGGGFTPNIELSYGPLPDAHPRLYTVGYGDLVNVLFENQDSFGYLEVTFTADPGWRIALHSLDLAAYSAVGPIRSIVVRDGDNRVLFEQRDVSISSTTRTNFSFMPPLDGQILILAVDSGNLGMRSDDIGLDNIVFSQVAAPVPVQATSWGRLKSLYR